MGTVRLVDQARWRFPFLCRFLGIIRHGFVNLRSLYFEGKMNETMVQMLPKDFQSFEKRFRWVEVLEHEGHQESR